MSQLHQVTLNLTAAQLVAVATLLATGSAGNASIAAATNSPAPSPRTAEAGKGAAQETKGDSPELPKIGDFKAELVPLLQAFAKKDKAGFESLMKKHGFSKVTDIEAKPETWGTLALACKG